MVLLFMFVETGASECNRCLYFWFCLQMCYHACYLSAAASGHRINWFACIVYVCICNCDVWLCFTTTDKPQLIKGVEGSETYIGVH